LHLKDVDADLPIHQTLLVGPRGGISIPKPSGSIFDRQAASSSLYRHLRRYTGKRAKLAVGGVTLDESIAALNTSGHVISTARRKNAIDRLSLDLALKDGALLLDRLYVKALGGDIAGAIQAQVTGIDPPDARAAVRAQVTGVNLAYLDPEATEHTARTEVSALLDLEYELCRAKVEGRIEINELSLDMLDALLAYLDPNRLDPNVQKTRKLLGSWVVKAANPRVELVSIWISYGNLNMDIEMDAIFPVGLYLRRTLEQNRIRRLNIRPFLDDIARSAGCRRNKAGRRP
jgi:hypothetical protein